MSNLHKSFAEDELTLSAGNDSESKEIIDIDMDGHILLLLLILTTWLKD